MPPLSIVNCKTQELFSKKNIEIRSFINFFFTLQVFFIKNITLAFESGLLLCPRRLRLLTPLTAFRRFFYPYPAHSRLLKKLKSFAKRRKI
jgi:hypothetical protein